ncbi:sugar ABC transporter substrate-binding protein [Actinophytocola sp.]|uniref:sugar ABC transporter substrate-binding protein n=1 Tax=Actinophytocola sp. TaxID=1872138 RepID=UPI002ED0B952
MSHKQFSRRDVLRFAGAAAVAAPFATGCGAGAPASDAGGAFTVYWNAGHGYQAYQQVIDEFQKAHGVTVNFQKYQWPDLRTRLLADFASGTVPDVVETQGAWVQEFAVSGDALSLQDYVAKDGAAMEFPDDWLPATVARNTYQDRLYGAQMHYTCSLLLYNKEMVGDTPPSTWDELLTAARELTTGDVYGIALNQDSSYAWPWLLQNGVRFYDPSSRRTLVDRDAAVEALQFQADLAHKHKVSPVPVPSTDYAGPQKLLSAKRAAMIITGPWDLKPITESSPDLDLGIAPALRQKEQATISAGASLMVPTKAARPDLSWDFIKRVTALDVERAATREAGMLMPRKSWAGLPEVQADERTKAFADGLPYAVDYLQDLGPTGKSGEIADNLFKQLYQSVVVQNTPVTEALAVFDAAAEQALAG